MANSFFKFKQFTIFHDKCAMKVGTDGVLLGAWCDTDNCQRILDVGCGTGLISLMIAQRSPAHIDAIDIDSNACMQALENANRSPFAGQAAEHGSPHGYFAIACPSLRLQRFIGVQWKDLPDFAIRPTKHFRGTCHKEPFIQKQTNGCLSHSHFLCQAHLDRICRRTRDNSR